MKKLVKKDIKLRKNFKKNELKRLYLKSITLNQNVSNNQRFKAQLNLSDLPKNSSKHRIKNRCVVTGRPKSVFKQFKLSRITLKQYALNGDIPGLKKISW
jgi:small subunit ribosomal protein S14|uniref:Ribosomal protein S14 n=1 Tax=Thecamonas trahens TaxID=529818 RepID=A0A0B5H7Y7_THETB|nr:ribosomal protein S14 [Thecamonas trahens]AJF36650.1 ribosomal protein S14 [Thecamonas trahens]